jgi:hypothetical protein
MNENKIISDIELLSTVALACPYPVGDMRSSYVAAIEAFREAIIKRYRERRYPRYFRYVVGDGITAYMRVDGPDSGQCVRFRSDNNIPYGENEAFADKAVADGNWFEITREEAESIVKRGPHDEFVRQGLKGRLDREQIDRAWGGPYGRPPVPVDLDAVQADFEGIDRWVCAARDRPADMAGEPEEFRVFRPWMDQWWGEAANVAGDSEEMEVCVAPRPDAPSLLQPSSLNHRYTIDLLPSPPPPLLIDILLLP